MRTLRNVVVGLSGGAVVTVLACSGSLDGYATGGAGAGSGTTGHGGATGSGTLASGTLASGTLASGGATSGGGMPGSQTAATGTTTGTTTTPCTMCGGTCVDTTDDASNCGQCGVACATGYGCLQSVCGNVVVDASSFLASCAVLKAGEVWCWGRDVWGEIGVPSKSGSNTTCSGSSDRCLTTPAKVAGVSGAVQVVAGRQATCALTAAGAVYCWGSNLAGLLGHNPAGDPTCMEGTAPTSSGPCSSTPTQVVFSPPVVVTQLAMGTVDACVLTSTHDVWCWGSNASGQIASPPSTAVVSTPTKNANVSGDADEVIVSADISGVNDAICVRRSTTHEVDCWGASASGTLFPATSSPGQCNAGMDNYCTAHSTPVPMVFSAPGGAAVTADALSMGPLVGVALQGTKVLTWGSDYYGQGALGTQVSHFDPRQILASTPVSAVSAIGLDTLLLAADGTVWTLGWSDYGQMGNGMHGLATGTCPNPTTTQGCGNSPLQIPPASLSGVTKVIGGVFGSAAITATGKLYMWGANYDASLGHAPGTMGDVNCGTGASPLECADVPVAVTALP